jgi:hypothetical protein
MQNGKVHRDVRWRNIGKYRSRSGAVALVVFDLFDVVDYDVDAHQNWIEEAMHYKPQGTNQPDKPVYFFTGDNFVDCSA